MAILMNHSGRVASRSQLVSPGKKLPMNRPSEQGQDVARLAGQADGPGNAEAGSLVGRRGDVGVVAQERTAVAQGKDDGEAGGETRHVNVHGPGSDAKHDQQEQVGQQQADRAGQGRVILGNRRNGFVDVHPLAGLDAPTEEVEPGQERQRHDRRSVNRSRRPSRLRCETRFSCGKPFSLASGGRQPPCLNNHSLIGSTGAYGPRSPVRKPAYTNCLVNTCDRRPLRS